MDWRMIEVDKQPLMIRFIKEANKDFIVHLSDLKVLWRERIEWKEIVNRVKVSYFATLQLFYQVYDKHSLLHTKQSMMAEEATITTITT